MKKTRSKKYCDTVPLKCNVCFVISERESSENLGKYFHLISTDYNYFNDNTNNSDNNNNGKIIIPSRVTIIFVFQDTDTDTETDIDK